MVLQKSIYILQYQNRDNHNSWCLLGCWDAIPCSLVECYQHYGGTLVTIDETTWCHIPEDRMFILNLNLKEMCRASVGHLELHWVHCK